MDRVQFRNESRIQRDTSLVVPLAENLFLGSELDQDYIADEMNAEWTRCATMGAVDPSPIMPRSRASLVGLETYRHIAKTNVLVKFDHFENWI